MKKKILMLVVLASLVLIMSCKKEPWTPSGNFTLKEFVANLNLSDPWFEENGFSKNSDGLYISYSYRLIETSREDCKECVDKILKKLDEGDFTILPNTGFSEIIVLNNPD